MFLSLPVSKLILLKVETHLIIFSLCFGLLSFCPNNYLIILNLSFGLLSFYPSQQLQIAEKLFSYWLVTSPWKCCEERGKGNLKTWKLENNNYWKKIHADTRWPRTRPLKLKPTHARQCSLERGQRWRPLPIQRTLLGALQRYIFQGKHLRPK